MFSVRYLVYNNCKPISEVAFGRGSRELRILKLLLEPTEKIGKIYIFMIGIIQEYLKKGSVFIK